MKKSEIQFHSVGCGRQSHPAINVKCYHFAHGLDVAKEFGCDRKTADKALEYAYQSACEMFWETVQEIANYHLGPGYKVYSEGRQSGWLVVHGLPDVESWNAILVSKWTRFAKAVAADIAYRADADNVREDIESNQWAKPGAEQYNFARWCKPRGMGLRAGRGH